VHTVYTPRHKIHSTDTVQIEGVPFASEEVPVRAEAILDALRAAGVGPVVSPTDHGIDPILAIHDADFVDFLRHAYEQSAAYFGEAGPVFVWTPAPRGSARKPQGFMGKKGYYAFGWGTPILEGTWEAAYWSVQCALTAADLVKAGEMAVYALCRPPGHHAAAALFGGFCYLNNAAVAARYLQQSGRRVAVLDVDYHHGNGTQSIFYSDATVLYCSVHAHPDNAFPYFWGGSEERGEGQGRGTNFNYPLRPEISIADYVDALGAALGQVRAFGADVLVLCVGFDIVAGDPLGGFDFTIDDIGTIAQAIADWAWPTLIVQEGGYWPENLGEQALAFLRPFA
jgi:acetoin utilization deacetylase AcuC-like enzyme